MSNCTKTQALCHESTIRPHLLTSCHPRVPLLSLFTLHAASGGRPIGLPSSLTLWRRCGQDDEEADHGHHIMGIMGQQRRSLVTVAVSPPPASVPPRQSVCQPPLCFRGCPSSVKIDTKNPSTYEREVDEVKRKLIEQSHHIKRKITVHCQLL